MSPVAIVKARVSSRDISGSWDSPGQTRGREGEAGEGVATQVLGRPYMLQLGKPSRKKICVRVVAIFSQTIIAGERANLQYSVCLSVCLSVGMFFSLSVCLYICLYFFLYVCLFFLIAFHGVLLHVE